MISEVYNEDNMIGMARYPDGYFDLAIVDPPYGLKINQQGLGKRKGKRHTYSKGGDNWDNTIPGGEYFSELFRVSKNQIIWGGNYFTMELPASPCWLAWNKITPDGMSFADFELAWTSFKQVAREVRIRQNGAIVGNGGGVYPAYSSYSKAGRVVRVVAGQVCQAWRQDSRHPHGQSVVTDRRLSCRIRLLGMGTRQGIFRSGV